MQAILQKNIEIVSTLNYLKFHKIFAFCSQRFRAVPSVALLLSSSSLFSFQGAAEGCTLKIKQCKGPEEGLTWDL